MNFPAEFFSNNRNNLKQQIKNKCPIIVSASGMLQRGADAAYPFHQDANFWYLTGLNDPDLVLVILPNEEYIILPDRSSYQDIFEGSISLSDLTDKSGISTLLTNSVGWQRLDSQLQTVDKVNSIKPSFDYLKTYGMYTNPARKVLVSHILKSNPNLSLNDITPNIARLRSVKQEIEISQIQEAIDLTIEAINTVKTDISKLGTEAKIEALISAHFITNNSLNSWKPIVASGSNATIMHYNSNETELSKGNLVMIDIGAECSHYSADITRTLSINKKPSSRQIAVFNAVLEVQEYGISLQKPGALIPDNEKKIRKLMGQKLIDLGLIKNQTEEQIAKYFPHATSHFLGLEPHDVGDYLLPLEPGNILTVEPGIYIKEEGIGIRIEDDVLITKDGNQVLSSKLSRDLV